MKKLTLIAGAAVGYVLGARAGRERYDQIKDAAGKVRRNPRVQSVVEDVQAEATAKAQQAASKVTETVRQNLGSDPDPDDIVPSGPVSGAGPELPLNDTPGVDKPLPGSTS